MSKSLKRVRAAIADAGLACTIHETGLAKTAQQAADEVGCAVDQIAKSIIFAGQDDGTLFLFITAGAQRVDMARAASLAGQALQRADSADVRKITGFAIGGVSPLGHLTPIRAYFDETLMGFGRIFAAAGTPNHVFDVAPGDLLRASGAQLGRFIVDPAAQ